MLSISMPSEMAIQFIESNYTTSNVFLENMRSPKGAIEVTPLCSLEGWQGLEC
jgi:hypothetical protein